MDGVTIGFEGKVVVRDIDLEVRDGERLVIVGPSGAGKTTLLRAIAGFVEPIEGRIDISGRDATAIPTERRNAVYMHQSPVLFPHLSVFENVAFPLRVRRIPESEIVARVASSLAAMRLTGFAKRIPRTLSGGERHRVALARAIVARPGLLLLDEPFGSLDPTLRTEIREAVREAHAQYHPALVLVTHDFDDAALIADRIGVLIDGQLAQVATPSELFARPVSLRVARFLGIANEIQGTADGLGNFSSDLGKLDGVCEGLQRGPAVAVFRPSAVRVDTAGFSGRVSAFCVRPDQSTMILATTAGRVESVMPVSPDISVGDEIRVALDPRQVVVYGVNEGQESSS